MKHLLNGINPEILKTDSADQVILIASCSLFNLNYKDNTKLIKFIFTVLQGMSHK